MRIGIFADAHDHVDHVRLAIETFNRLDCELVIFAGDFVSPIVVPAMRKLKCPMIASFGDNEGNKVGIIGGMRIVGCVGEPPFGLQTADGTRILVTHILQKVRGLTDGADVVVFAHTHKPSITRNEQGCLFVNPGETSGWTYRRPSVAILETVPLEARLIELAGTDDGDHETVSAKGHQSQ